MKIMLAAVAAASVALASPAFAALKVGDKAPDFTLKAATNGAVSDFSLKQALKTGPVVVYFYPKAFTGGCSLEAHQFSVAIDKFAAKKARVVGVSTDDIDTLKKFSTADCQGKFPVAADTSASVAKDYDAKLPMVDMAGRVSYVISKDGRIAFVHDSGDAATHVPALLAAVGAK